MGLGKTLQILAFMAWYRGSTPDPKSILVIAPVALLEKPGGTNTSSSWNPFSGRPWNCTAMA